MDSVSPVDFDKSFSPIFLDLSPRNIKKKTRRFNMPDVLQPSNDGQLIFRGLMSSVEQDRKQELYIMKKIIDFSEKLPAKSSATKLIPFI
ncbi:hypothetical protein KQX54_016102 [Cotesia glomerata]|uniref:Uncharacterized protein n=1 Tax=Cotesia glomerata TaxID=32391 RepID=A0AAV7J6L7_COTGL|nr:hypothetical protein KQX54_016102 [Cotesia glomerata]